MQSRLPSVGFSEPAMLGTQAPLITTVIAAYAALLSTTTAVLGFIQWRIGNATRVKVTMAPMSVVLSDGSVTEDRIVLVRMTNLSRHAVAITHVSFKRKGTDEHLYIPRPLPIEEPIPIAIEARRSKQVWVTHSVLADHLGEPLSAHISTDDGRNFDSKWVVLAEVVRKNIAEGARRRLSA